MCNYNKIQHQIEKELQKIRRPGARTDLGTSASLKAEVGHERVLDAVGEIFNEDAGYNLPSGQRRPTLVIKRRAVDLISLYK